MQDLQEYKEELRKVIAEYKELRIGEQVDYQKFYLYSLITHSTAIEGSTVTELENQMLFDEGISANGRPMIEQLMNLDLKKAYEQAFQRAEQHSPITVELLKEWSAWVMRNTGGLYKTLTGDFDSSKGDLRLVNVTAGVGEKSYMNYLKVPARLTSFCEQLNEKRETLLKEPDDMTAYLMSFDAHNQLVAIHPWVDGNGRMSRLLMNYLQVEFGLIPTKILKEDKTEYIQALIDSREEESLRPFQIFMLKEHIQNLKKEIAQFKDSMADDVLLS